MADEVVEYLVEKFSVAEIEDARAKVFSAHMAGLTEPVLIISTSMDGGTVNGQISVTPPQREHFLRQCRTALARLRGEATSMSPGLTIQWSNRRLET